MSTITNSGSNWNPSTGTENFVQLEGFDGYPSAPSGAKEISQSVEDGKYILRYKMGNSETAYQVSASVSQEPLATHIKFDSGTYAVSAAEWKMWKIYDGDPTDERLYGWKPDGDSASAGMKLFYAYHNKGVEDYLLGTVTLRVTTESSAAPTLSGVGFIATPSNAPGLSDARTWLLVGVDGEKTGTSMWKVTREYRASGPGGWDTFLYTAL
ncbi:MAG: hypothetical protein ACFUZC_16605 [Chthoniobacteraceae bacterium]